MVPLAFRAKFAKETATPRARSRFCINSVDRWQMMSDYVPEAADTLAMAMPQPDFTVPAEPSVNEKDGLVVAEDIMNEDDEAKENVVPPSSNVAKQSPGPSTPTKKRTKSGRIGKRELLQVASPKARWLPRTQERENRRGRDSIKRFEFEEKEVQPLWSVCVLPTPVSLAH
jgi:hypothetical protein